MDEYGSLLVVGLAQMFLLGVFSAYTVFLESVITENKNRK